ncbi:MAG: biotin/lipoyl-containing protein [Thermodesulfobacteriota bacterium]
MIEITAPMGAKVIDVKVKTDENVNKGDEIVILEAMKMEMPVVAVESGIVKEVKCNKGDVVEEKSILVVLE